MPESGVYVTKTEINGNLYKSLTNIGSAPTFGSSVFTTETFIPDFYGDLYNLNITVYFKEFIREVKKFGSQTELYEQIKKDLLKL